MMLNTRDQPTYYNIVDARTKVVIATAPKSKVQQLCRKLTHELGRELDIELQTPEP